MTTIPEQTKTALKNSGVRFNRDPSSETHIYGDLLNIASRAVGNAIQDDEPYTIRINFQNGRIVGSEANPRLSVELLEGRASTPTIGDMRVSNAEYVEVKYLVIEGFPTIANDGSWVVRLKVVNGNIASVMVNPDFGDEDRKLIEKVLMRGFADIIQM